MPDDVALMQQLHDEHGPALWAFCLRLVDGDRARAEDVVQETMLRAWRHRSALESPPGPLRAWLFTVARNVVIDQWRSSRNRHETSVSEVPEGSRSDETEQLLLEWMVAEALTKLS